MVRTIYTAPFEQVKTPEMQDTDCVPLHSSVFADLPAAVSPYSYDNTYPTLVRPTGIHGRAFDMVWTPHGVFYPQVIFGDTYGNTYASIGTKGNDFSNVKASVHSLEPSSVRVNGMQDASLVVRIGEASRILRAAGVDTEWLTYAVRPKHFPIDGRQYRLQDLRTELTHRIFHQTGDVSERTFDLLTILNALPTLRFAVTVRALKTPYRLTDLNHMRGRGPEARALMTEVILPLHNFEEQRKARLDPSYTPDIYGSTPDEVRRYITEGLPRKIGINTAKVNRVGATHGYLHAGNISLLGGLYDLDTVAHPDISDEDAPQTERDFVKDVAKLLDKNSFDHSWFYRMERELFSEVRSDLSTEWNIDDDWDTYIGHIIDAYLEARGLHGIYAVPYRSLQAANANNVNLKDIAEYLPEGFVAAVFDFFDNEDNLNRLVDGFMYGQPQVGDRFDADASDETNFNNYLNILLKSCWQACMPAYYELVKKLAVEHADSGEAPAILDAAKALTYVFASQTFTEVMRLQHGLESIDELTERLVSTAKAAKQSA